MISSLELSPPPESEPGLEASGSGQQPNMLTVVMHEHYLEHVDDLYQFVYKAMHLA